MNKYTQKCIEKIKQTVAEIMGCSTEEIIDGGIYPSCSFFVVLSLKTEYLMKLLNMKQKDKDKLCKLNIDYIIADLNVIYLERSKGTYWISIIYVKRHDLLFKNNGNVFEIVKFKYYLSIHHQLWFFLCVSSYQI